MTSLRQATSLTCLVLAAFILGVIAWHVPTWSRCIDKTLVHVDEFAGRGAHAMGKLEQASETSRQSSEETLLRVKEAQGVLQSLDHAAGSIRFAADKAGDSFDKVGDAADSVSATSVRIGNSFESVEDHASTALDSFPPAAEAFQQTFTGAANLLSDPRLQHTLSNLDTTGTNTAAITGDINTFVHGKLSGKKRTGFLGRLYTGAKTAELVTRFTYYYTNIK